MEHDCERKLQTRENDDIEHIRGSPGCCFVLSSNWVFEDGFSINRDLDDVANDDSAFVEPGIPTHAEIMPIDRDCRHKSGARLGTLIDAILPPGCLPLPQIPDTQSNLARYSADRQIAGHVVIVHADQLYSMTAESDPRVLLNIKKVAASQVGIACRIAGPKRRGIDYHFNNRRGFRLRRIEVERAVYIFEVSADVGHHHVPRAKFCGSMARFESPLCHVFVPSVIIYFCRFLKSSVSAFNAASVITSIGVPETGNRSANRA